ncbi:MAG TPA: hypothetical protein VHF89_11885 [Solirubrobacteraceae bacterium]|nr:hypothetical protein [Solirubrobacteraceae bacterium]
MPRPVMVAIAVLVAGAVFVVVYEPSAPASREHDWLAVAFIAATAGIFFAAGTSPRRRVLLLGVSYALFVLTTLAWFLESLPVWAALAVVVAGAVALVRRSAAPR